LSAGAVNATVAVVDPVAVAIPMVGAPEKILGLILPKFILTLLTLIAVAITKNSFI